MAENWHRASVYLPDKDFYDAIRTLLAEAPGPPQPFSALVVELLQDWYAEAQHAPALLDASPQEKRRVVQEMYVRQSLQLADEYRRTMAQIPPGREE